MKKLCSLLLLVTLSGCGSLHEQYVEADADTLEFATPKLEEWAQMKTAHGDIDWESIVGDKLTSWEARVERARKKLQEEGE